MHVIAHAHTCRFHDNSVDLKRKTAEVSSGRLSPKVALRFETARKDSAVHVSLSSDSLVKQLGTLKGPAPGKPESRRSLALPTETGSLITQFH